MAQLDRKRVYKMVAESFAVPVFSPGNDCDRQTRVLRNAVRINNLTSEELASAALSGTFARKRREANLPKE